MRLAVVGSRDFHHERHLREQLDMVADKIDVVISGGAKGADTFAAHWAIDHGKQLVIHRPDWVRYGKVAGYLRNQLIVNDCDELYAFPASRKISRGTQSSIDLASRAGKIVTIIHVDEAP